jgi:release factor glutamine methyltransferase
VEVDLLDGVGAGSLDAVVSNPPYVSTAAWERLPQEIRDFEPRRALDGGPDGLGVISRLVPQAVRALKSGGRLFLEIGEDQAEDVVKRMRAEGFANPHVTKDLAGHERIVCGRKE